MPARGVEIRRLAARDSVDALTELLHRAYAPLAAHGTHFAEALQDAATTQRRIAAVCRRDNRPIADQPAHDQRCAALDGFAQHRSAIPGGAFVDRTNHRHSPGPARHRRTQGYPTSSCKRNATALGGGHARSVGVSALAKRACACNYAAKLGQMGRI